jgi:putative transcriptional regulator
MRGHATEARHDAGVESTAGRLLVATPTLGDPNFAHTVVLMVDHSETGALGIVLNRPTATPLERELPGWLDRVVEPLVVFRGGPVQADDAVIGLAWAPGAPLATDPPADRPVGGSSTGADAWHALAGGAIGTVDLSRPPEEAGVDVVSLRVFAGYAGWGPGQLEVELARQDWYVLEVGPDDLFTSEPHRLWRTVLRRQPAAVAMAANLPLDPRVN